METSGRGSARFSKTARIAKQHGTVLLVPAKQWGRFCYVSQSETAEPSPAVSSDKSSGTQTPSPQILNPHPNNITSIPVTQLLRPCYTPVTGVSQGCHDPVTPLSHFSKQDGLFRQRLGSYRTKNSCHQESEKKWNFFPIPSSDRIETGQKPERPGQRRQYP